VKKLKTIIESVTRHLGSKGFDVNPTLEIADEADGTKPLIYYLISHLVDLPKHTATVSQKINNIIIFSGYSDTEKIEKAFKAGADLYIAKPVDILTIKQIIENAANSSEFPSKYIQEIDRVFAPN
jgi:ActR/RegA family two-component response regulator